jgi:predicted MFS family arabinose efflux permease
MNESRDPSRSSRIDWAGAAFAVLGLGGIVYGLLEWPRLGATSPIVIATLVCGAVSLCALVVAERRVQGPMLPPGLFTSRTFTLANVLTLLLYGALMTTFWLVPMILIQVRHYSATAAGAALLPFPMLMFLLSRWSGGLVSQVGSRLPLAAGPLIAAAGFALFRTAGVDGSYWTTFFPAVIVLGFGMAVVVAPLTTTVMGAIEPERAGVASGVNNAVSRVAGLLAIALFGIVLVGVFDVRVRMALDRLNLPAPARLAIERELPKLAGAEVRVLSDVDQQTAVRGAIDTSLIAAFRVVMTSAAAVALAAAGAGALIRDDRRD